jgi:hypothetical protein
MGSGIGITPIPFGVTPVNSSFGLISPLALGPSPMGILSPLGKPSSLVSPWSDFGRTVFTSPGKVEASPPSLLENRAELVNLIMHQ